MRVIISPAKKMRVDTDTFPCRDLPVFLQKTGSLMEWIQGLSFSEQKKLWACNEQIARENAKRFAGMDLERNLTPAILSFDGIQYTYMAPSVLETDAFAHMQRNLRILSGFYGVLKPMDGVVPYRLEMRAKVTVRDFRNLYEFWGDALYQEVIDSSRIVVNLASKEYSRCIERYICPGDRFISCVFGELENEKVLQKGVYAKWPEEIWSVIWQRTRSKPLNNSKAMTDVAITSMSPAPLIRSMSLYVQRSPANNSSQPRTFPGPESQIMIGA